MNIYESIRNSLNETNYLKKYYNKLDTMSDKALYKAWLEVKDAPDEEGSSEEIEYTMASDALWEIEGELCRRGYLDEDNNKTDKWKELEESSDVERDLAIEPGSVEEEILNGLYEEKKIEWTDLGGSDQTAVEHYFSNYGRDFSGKCWDDIESEIRSACHEIGYANEELIDDGYWSDGDMDPEPNEKLVQDYIFFNHFIPFINKKKDIKESAEDGIRKKQLINNIEDLVYTYDNGISDGDFEPFKSEAELIKYVYAQVFDQKSDGQGSTRYGDGICRDLKYLGKDYIYSEIKRIGNEAGVVNTEINEAEDEGSRFIEVSSKSVEDSDGFMTDYTLYQDVENNKWVTVFGDKDIYRPEDEEFDNEFDSEDEANEWFHSYTGFAEGEEADWKVFDNYYNKLALPVPGEAELYGADLSDLCDYVEKQQGLHNKREALNYIYEKKLPKSYFPKEYFEGEDFKETPKSVASLKSLLEQLADMDFYHNMKDNWTREDFEIDDRNNKKIQDVIAQLKDQGVETKYRMGYPIEYSDEIAKEAEEDKLSNEEWFKLHEDEVKALDAEPFEINKTE